MGPIEYLEDDLAKQIKELKEKLAKEERKVLIAIDTLSGIACNQFEHPCDMADESLKKIYAL